MQEPAPAARSAPSGRSANSHTQRLRPVTTITNAEFRRTLSTGGERQAVPDPEPKPPIPPDPPDPNPPTFPRFLAPFARILLTVALVGGYLGIFGVGLWLGWMENGHKDFPTSKEAGQAVIAGLGGLAATLFTVALNLPRDRNTVFKRAAMTIGLRRWPGWDTIDRKVLIFFGVLLVICYIPFSIFGFVETLARKEEDVPAFIVSFAGPGMGILVTAVTISFSRLTRPTG
jgi:hypothetical protein